MNEPGDIITRDPAIIVTDVLGRTFAIDLEASSMHFQETDREVILRVGLAIENGKALSTEHGIVCFSPRHVVSIHWGSR